MKTTHIILGIIGTLYFTSSCGKEFCKPFPQIRKESLDIIWRVPIVPDTNHNFTISMNPCLHDKYVIFGSQYSINDVNAPIMFMDTASGKILHYWNDYTDGSDAFSGEQTAHEGNFLLLRSSPVIECINLNNQSKHWASWGFHGIPKIYSHQGYAYATVSFNNNRSNVIMRTPVNQESWDTVYSFTQTDKYHPGFDSFGFGQLPNGDEVIVWKNRNWGANGYPTDVFAFNLSADTLMWRNQDLELNSRVNPLQVESNRVIGNVRSTLFAIDLETGGMLWTKNLGKALGPNAEFNSLEAIYIGETSIVVKGTGDKLVGVLKKSGDINWVQENSGGVLDDRFTYFEGKLFFPATGLRIVDAQTGEALISESLSQEIEDIESKIIIDPDRRCMYFHNGREAFCVRIPKGI